MSRNKEFFYFFMIAIAAAILCTIIVFTYSRPAGIVCGAGFLAVHASFYLFTRKRYKNLRELSEYLASVYAGSRVFDIRDNQEGELSILKNDIYKVTTILSEQSQTLKKDKEYLAETLSNISHQLKTPLTSMFVMADLLRDDELPEEKREEFTEKIISQLKRIEWLVSSLLRMAKLEAGAVELKQETLMLKNVIEDALLPLWIPAELKSQDIELKCGEELSITADKNWTVEAFINVLKNCIEHTPENGKITIECEETPIFIRVAVKDSGLGIAKEDLPHIFERFYKGKNAGADSIGIGLAMSKTILNSQNAEIAVEDGAGAGAVFVIQFNKLAAW